MDTIRQPATPVDEIQGSLLEIGSATRAWFYLHRL